MNILYTFIIRRILMSISYPSEFVNRSFRILKSFLHLLSSNCCLHSFHTLIHSHTRTLFASPFLGLQSAICHLHSDSQQSQIVNRKSTIILPSNLLPTFYSLLLTLLLSSPSHPQSLKIHHINVGQGDATLIHVRGGQSMLIDAGDKSYGNNKVYPFLDSLGITSLDYLTASHYHSDHIGGLVEVLERLTPNSVFNTYDRGDEAPLPSTVVFSKYWKQADKTHNHTKPYLGQVIHLSPEVQLLCVSTNGFVLNYGMVRERKYDENNRSIGWLLTFRKTIADRTYSFDYFTGGDCGGSNTTADLETPLAAIVGDVDAIKLNHHGSQSSTNQTFLDSLRPEIVVISVGNDNHYHHPSQVVLDRLAAAPSVKRIYQTEQGYSSLSPKLRILGTVSISVFDSLYVVDKDTFRIRAHPSRISSIEKARDRIHSDNRVTQPASLIVQESNISVTVNEQCYISLKLYSLLGKEIAIVNNGYHQVGTYRYNVRTLNLPSGLYFIRLSSPFGIQVSKMLVLR